MFHIQTIVLTMILLELHINTVLHTRNALVGNLQKSVYIYVYKFMNINKF